MSNDLTLSILPKTGHSRYLFADWKQYLMDEVPNRLIAKAKNGNLVAFEEIVNLTVTDVRCLIAYHFPDSTVIDDIAQDVYLYAFKSLNKYKSGSFTSWLKAIVWNKIRAEKKTLQRQQKNYHSLQSYICQKSTHSKPKTETKVEECLSRLNEENRQLLEFKYRDTYSSREIAGFFERTEEWVRVSLYRLRKILKDCLSERSS